MVYNFLFYLLRIKDSTSIFNRFIFYLRNLKLSNLCAHKSISEKLMETNNQDVIFKDLSDFALIEAQTNAVEKSLHEASISFFFNLISAYHLEKKVKVLDQKQKILYLAYFLNIN